MPPQVASSAELTSYHFTPEEAEKLKAAGFGPGVAEEAARFTLDDVFEMVRIGALDPDAKVELIDGELIVMAPEGVSHLRAKLQLANAFFRRAGEEVQVVVDSTLRLSPTCAPDPDLYLYDASLALESIDGASVGLVIEVAQTTLGTDLTAKAQVYARHGVRDYWVLDVEARRLVVHREPSNGAYVSVTIIEANELAAPLAFPALAIRLGDLPAIR